MNAKARLQGLEAALRERGVVDVKFFFNMSPDAPLSEVAMDVADGLDAVLAGKYAAFSSIGDRQQV